MAASLSSPRTAAPRHETRRRRFGTRTIPLIALALLSLGSGVVVGARHDRSQRQTAQRFLAAWSRGDYAGMYRLLSPAAQGRVTLRRFAGAYRAAAAQATLQRVQVGRVRHAGGRTYEAPIAAQTKVFGTLRTVVRVRLSDDDPAGVAWGRSMTFPGLRPGETLRRDVTMPPRGDLEARDGQVLASGPQRVSQVGPVAAQVVGTIGPIPADQAAGYAAQGYPPNAIVGLTGLERQFEARLAGSFGGTLRAGARVLASVQPRQGSPVRTSLDLGVEQAAVTALAGRFGGVAVLRPRTGEVLGLAGIAYSAPQPPGSTFKIVTLSGVLEDGVAKPTATFPYATYATLSGVKLENANGESCGGPLQSAFATSCNSVFAPLGAKLGADRLVATARRFGFDEPSDIQGAPTGSIPPAERIGDDLAVGSTAIGQGQVTATPLRMAEVAAAIANRGLLVRPTLLRGAQGRTTRAVSARTARVVARFMRSVVKPGGTGSAAAIPGVAVAGKTGTAELRSTVPTATPVPGQAQPQPDDTTDTDAWFVAFAPASRPRVAVAVLLVGQGAGGATAAPAARVVLEGAL